MRVSINEEWNLNSREQGLQNDDKLTDLLWTMSQL
jgi:hypothetical protein